MHANVCCTHFEGSGIRVENIKFKRHHSMNKNDEKPIRINIISTYIIRLLCRHSLRMWPITHNVCDCAANIDAIIVNVCVCMSHLQPQSCVTPQARERNKITTAKKNGLFTILMQTGHF